MKSATSLTVLAIIATSVACSSSQQLDIPCSSAYPEPAGGNGSPSGSNVLAITVNGTSCDNAQFPNNQYFNEPCASITICQHGTTNCATINDMLVDTGSYGIRVFSSALTANHGGVSLPGTTVNDPVFSQPLAECAEFGTGSDWGAVQLYDLTLGGETASNVPVQVIDNTFSGGAPGGQCGTPDTDPNEAGFNGIIGLGLFAADCGNDCVGNANIGNGWYYSCNGSTCQETSASLADQVTNPVSFFPTDNQGVAVMLPPVPASGTTTLNGYVLFGIGSQANNTPSGVKTFPTNGNGEFNVVFNSDTDSSGSNPTYPGIIDSGSNALYFDSGDFSNLSQCGDGSGFYCAGCTAVFNATNVGAPGTPQGSVSFQIANFGSLQNATPQNAVYSNVGGDVSQFFDWGIPFFYGRTIYVAIQGASTPLGAGPYWAY